MEQETLDKYVANINQYPLLSRKEERALLKAYRKGDLKAGQKVVTHNLRFVVKVAHSFKGYGLSMHDLIQEGNKAMLVALKKFKPSKGVKFCSYAVWWIKAYMSNYVVKNHSVIKFGTNQKERQLFYSLKKTKEMFEKFGLDDVNAGLAEHFNITEEEVKINLARLDSHFNINLTRDYGAREGKSGAETNRNMAQDRREMVVIKKVKADILSQEEQADNDKLRQNISNTITNMKSKLSEREICLLENRLSSDEPMTLEAIGQRFGVSRERIRQTEAQLILKLKNALWEYETT